MKRGKWMHLSVTSLSIACMSFSALAAPKLTMHVFEEPSSADNETQLTEIKSTNTYQPSSVANNKAKEPERLKLHVYDRRPERKAPPLTYDYADIYIKTGYRSDDLQWSIAGLGGQPNILSELTWQDLEIATINLGGTLYLKNNWFVNGDLVWGEIFDGENQDSDYFGNNRTLEFSRSNNGADEGNILDISVAAGHRFEWPLNQADSSRFELRPKLGLAYHSQNLKIVDGYQTIPANGPFEGLDSSYDTTWFGPWAGLEAIFIKENKFSLGLNLEYHYFQYDAEAQWNLRSDFAQPVSFEHEAEGTGWVAGVNSKWYVSPALALTLDFEYRNWLADRDGVDTVYFSNGSVGSTELNEVDWESYGFSLGLNYDF